MHRAITIFALFVVLVSAGSAFGDGVMVSKSDVHAKVDIPDQEALIHWADGVETLVIQTSFTGEGDAFAWVVPTPGRPEVTASTTGLFTTLRTLTAPTMRHPQMMWSVGIWLVVLVVGGYVFGRAWAVLGILALVFFAMGVFLPALGSARGVAVVAGVRVHGSGVVGDYEVAVISADDPDSLASWLDDNGFHISADTDAAIKAYVDDGWFFTAARLTRDADVKDKSATHPLAFRFKSDQPVYPLRLTATGSSALAVDLYVFGPQRAAAQGFVVAFCERLAFPDPPAKDDWYQSWSGEGVPVFHPELRSRVEPAAFVTKLSANLSPADMAHDAAIQWDGEQTYVPTRWTYPGAKVLATNVVFAGLALTVLAMLLLAPKDMLRREAKGKAVVCLIGAAIFWPMIGGGVYYALPKAEANIVRLSRVFWRILPRELADETVDARDIPEEFGTHQSVQAWIDGLEDRPRNPAEGGPIRAEDSPGNVTVEQTDDGLVFTVYGPEGAPLRIGSGQPEQE